MVGYGVLRGVVCGCSWLSQLSRTGLESEEDLWWRGVTLTPTSPPDDHSPPPLSLPLLKLVQITIYFRSDYISSSGELSA